MKIVIVENPRPLTIEHYNDVANAPLSASLNSGYALAVARRAGWDTAYLDFSSSPLDSAEIAVAIQAEAGDLILFHWVYAWGHEQTVYNTLALLHKEGAPLVGAFGLFPTLSNKRLLQHAPHLDFILAGEFEATLAELLHVLTKQHTLQTVPGIVLRDAAFTPRELINDLTHLQTPDDVGTNCNYTNLNIAASRGCYGACSFCFITPFYGCSRRRTRTVASLERELETRLARRHINSLYFIDPSFIGQGNTENQRISEISQLAHGLGLPFGFETRVDSIDRHLLSKLANNGATSIFLGIESGCDAVLKRIGKQISKSQVINGVRAVQESGIQLAVGFIMFEPDTNLAELGENYNILEELGLLSDHDLTANLLYHNQIVLYGSAAWDRFEHDGRLLADTRLPFEARYRFLDERVNLVCSAMGQLATEYFKLMDNSRKENTDSTKGCCNCTTPDTATQFDGDTVNQLLKEAFRAYCAAAENPRQQQFNRLKDRYVTQLQDSIR